MTEKRQNQIAWIVGLIFLAAVAAGIVVQGPQTESTRAESVRVYTEQEMDAIVEYNDNAPEWVDEGETWIPGG